MKGLRNIGCSPLRSGLPGPARGDRHRDDRLPPPSARAGSRRSTAPSSRFRSPGSTPSHRPRARRCSRSSCCCFGVAIFLYVAGAIAEAIARGLVTGAWQERRRRLTIEANAQPLHHLRLRSRRPPSRARVPRVERALRGRRLPRGCARGGAQERRRHRRGLRHRGRQSRRGRNRAGTRVWWPPPTPTSTTSTSLSRPGRPVPTC